MSSSSTSTPTPGVKHQTAANCKYETMQLLLPKGSVGVVFAERSSGGVVVAKTIPGSVTQLKVGDLLKSLNGAAFPARGTSLDVAQIFLRSKDQPLRLLTIERPLSSTSSDNGGCGEREKLREEAICVTKNYVRPSDIPNTINIRLPMVNENKAPKKDVVQVFAENYCFAPPRSSPLLSASCTPSFPNPTTTRGEDPKNNIEQPLEIHPYLIEAMDSLDKKERSNDVLGIQVAGGKSQKGDERKEEDEDEKVVDVVEESVATSTTKGTDTSATVEPSKNTGKQSDLQKRVDGTFSKKAQNGETTSFRSTTNRMARKQTRNQQEDGQTCKQSTEASANVKKPRMDDHQVTNIKSQQTEKKLLSESDPSIRLALESLEIVERYCKREGVGEELCRNLNAQIRNHWFENALGNSEPSVFF